MQCPDPGNEEEEHCQEKESWLSLGGVEPFDQASVPTQPAACQTAGKTEEVRAQIGLGPFAAEKGQEPCSCAQGEQQRLERTSGGSG